MEAQILDAEGKEAGAIALSDKVFGAKPRPSFLHEIVTAYLANQRSGTAHTKTKAEVSGGGHKPWKQKHTGRARQGSIRSPLWRKGGVVFGPKPRSYRQELPREKQLNALGQALSARQAEGAIRFIETPVLEKKKTAELARLLKAVKTEGRTVLVLVKTEAGLKRTARNIPELSLRLASDLNAYEVLRARSLVITREGLAGLSSRFEPAEK